MSTTKHFWHNGIYSTIKIGTSILLALIVTLLEPFPSLNLMTKILLGWDIFSFTLLTFYWISFFKTPIAHIQSEAAREDHSRSIIFLMILFTVLASMLLVIFLLVSGHSEHNNKVLPIIVSIIGMTCSWSLLHTIFTVRYAHMYYDNNESKGLEFPGEDKPDFLDFAYFSYVLGMTFQVSDISITDRAIRKIVLWHSLLSFGYNAVIIAMSINIIAGI